MPAIVDVAETESELVSLAQSAVSQCNWVVGECAAKWTVKYARGRTDGDFGALVGLSADQVYQRRRVWETFGDVSREYAGLKWSHFYVALTWDDAPECLQWAQENEATVAEMKAWRRTVQGEGNAPDEPEDDWGSPPTVAAKGDVHPVRDPDEFGISSGRSGGGSSSIAESIAGFARESEMPPFDADGPSASEDAIPPARAAARGDVEHGPSTEQVVKRMVSTLEKFRRSMTADFESAFRSLPGRLRGQLLQAVDALAERAAELKE